MEINSRLTSDTSLERGSGIHNKEYFHVKFAEFIMSVTSHIAQRELLMVLITLKLWAPQLSGKVVGINTVSQWVMNAINNSRTQDKFMLVCLRDIAWIGAKYQILLRASYISSRANQLSHWYIDGTNAWHKFKQLTNSMWKCRSVKAAIFNFSSSWWLYELFCNEERLLTTWSNNTWHPLITN